MLIQINVTKYVSLFCKRAAYKAYFILCLPSILIVAYRCLATCKIMSNFKEISPFYSWSKWLAEQRVKEDVLRVLNDDIIK